MKFFLSAGLALIYLGPAATGLAQTKEAAKDIAVRLAPWIQQEVADKKIPALSIALVDDQTLLWAKTFGERDDPMGKPATGPLYRVGSVSKPFTALLLMMLLEQGLIDLDDPISKHLSDFRPKNSTDKAITIRQMLCHRSGLVRESPVGSYFDDTEPPLAKTVASLNQTALIYAPEAKTSYSNAAFCVLGRIVEVVGKKEFADFAQSRLLEPVGMSSSSFAPTKDLKKLLPPAVMWTYHGKFFPAPTWDLGMPPAGSLYSTVQDQARFMNWLFAGGKTDQGQLLKKDTLEKMWKVQFPDGDGKAGFGLGFFVSEFEGKKRIGHGGAVYGFATELAFLPEEKLGVIVCSARDVSNGLTRRIADAALRQLLAARAGKELPTLETTKKLTLAEARQFAGRYAGKKQHLDLLAYGPHLYLLPGSGGIRQELRWQGKDLIVDDPMAFGPKVEIRGDLLVINKDEYRRQPDKQPAACPKQYLEYLGEYGPDHNILYLLERDGKLCTLIEWEFLYPLKEIGKDEFQFPDFGLYHGDKLRFQRDAAGKVQQVEAASVLFRKRPLRGLNIELVRPIEQLLKAARLAKPPEEKNPLGMKPDLVDLAKLDADWKFDIRYAGKDNFLGTPVYPAARAFMQRPAAEALQRVHQQLTKEGYGLLMHDAYRPWHVTKVFFDATPPKFHLFVADPMQGSRHNRGCAVDLTLFDRATGQPVDMVGAYDEFSERSYPEYLGGTSLQRWRRDLLRRAMEAEGFNVFEAEWWHFDYRDWRRYPILNVEFDQVK
jgi:CubicO group peptidase (beta-lactamase class C family)/D-alanyl-D-alanine dipeptidase